MPSKKKRLGNRPGIWFGLLCLVSVLTQALPLAYGALEGDAAALLAALHPFVTLLPALLGPFLAARNGVPALLAFFPPGLCFLLSPVYPAGAAFGGGMLLLSLASAAAGEELARRKSARETEKAARGGKKRRGR